MQRLRLNRFGRRCRYLSTASSTQSLAAWEVNPHDPDFERLAASSIEKHGFVILPGLLSGSSLDRLSPFVSRTNEMVARLKEKGVQLGVGSSAGFHEVCLRSPNRYDVPCDFDLIPDDVRAKFEGICTRILADGDEAASSSSSSSSSSDAKAQPTLRRAFAGIVRSEPGSTAQLWHADSPHQTPEHGPANLLNVLVAMRDFTLEDGPTEFAPGSHRLTNHLKPGVAFGEEILYQAPTNSPERIGSTAAAASGIPAGSAVIFDDRILHRGGANKSQKTRDVAFFSYRRSSFMPSTHYEATRSLATYDHRSLAAGVRGEFPGLDPPGEARRPILADGASGSQLHASVLAAIETQMRYGIANIGGSYASSRKAEAAVSGARSAMADFLNCAPREVAFGPTMTALTFHLARSFQREGFLRPGDNVVLDPISHGANVWTWAQLAKASGAEVRWLPVMQATSASDCRVDARAEALAAVIDAQTKLVAVGRASNGVGTVHDVEAVCKAAKELSKGSARTFVDAVHYAPHGLVDVAAIGCDFLACSPYKFFGPHSGLLFGREELFGSLPAERLDCSDDGLPLPENGNMSRWELGTQNYEALAGVEAAVDYLASLGSRFGGASPEAGRREALGAAWRAVEAHEHELKVRFLEGVANIPSLRLLGVADPERTAERTATFAVAKEGLSAAELAERLCERGIWCTAGNHYAGFWEKQSNGSVNNADGMTRIGLLHYNTLDEVDEILNVLEDC
eukprot:TRINITY_DN8258_c0_g1_i1.p1 TRINITY_DN8258_c0_g1~~TRINITY_DN8258_c0_g1_i1.p1  ORF type:complete len:740 (-),score=157.21 TRINITY_DN8258_c0_g1_i1:271-2490(-)